MQYSKFIKKAVYFDNETRIVAVKFDTFLNRVIVAGRSPLQEEIRYIIEEVFGIKKKLKNDSKQLRIIKHSFPYTSKKFLEKIEELRQKIYIGDVDSYGRLLG